jgi:S-(hydroxymethyl)glutathione dehydrogenase / alcohol dehydrogenase
VKVNPAADPSLACCLACGVTTGLGAVLRTAEVRPDSSVVVFGLGGVGLGAVQGARIAGASTIVAVDTNPAKEAVARKLGATHFLDARSPELVADVRALTTIGADYVFDCVGRASVYLTGMEMLVRGWGLLVGVGMAPVTDTFTVAPPQLSGITLARSFMGDAKRADVARYVDWFVEGRIDLTDIVSHRIALDEINEGYALLEAGEAVRVVVEY